MTRFWALVGIALAVAVGVALAPFVGTLLGLAVILCVCGAVIVALCVVYELLRREWVADRERPLYFPWYEAFQDRLDPVRAKCPAWVFDWRGVLVFLSPLWVTAIALTVLPFVMR